MLTIPPVAKPEKLFEGLKVTTLAAVLTILVILASYFIGKAGSIPADRHNTVARVEPTQTIVHAWTRADSVAYAHDQITINADTQFACLVKLWDKESSWNPKAYNPVRVGGKNAGGIPQLLGMNPLIPPTTQIDRGLRYIINRYRTPCVAWKFWEVHKWY